MDALALLCTLHADGPATLKRLRQVGCSSLEQIGTIELERLAELLGASTAAARRFAREARSLGERVGNGWLEREDASARLMSSAGTAAASEPHAIPLAPAEIGDGAALPLSDVALVERVLNVWRERDQAEVAAPLPERTIAPVVSTAPHARGPVSKPAATVRALAPGALDGLDAALCERLAKAGIETLDALAHADALGLSRALDVGYTCAYRLSFLAARALAAPAPLAAERAAPVRPVMKLSPSELPPSDLGSIEFEPLLEVPRSLLPALARSAPSRAVSAPVHVAAAPRENAGGPFV